MLTWEETGLEKLSSMLKVTLLVVNNDIIEANVCALNH